MIITLVLVEVRSDQEPRVDGIMSTESEPTPALRIRGQLWPAVNCTTYCECATLAKLFMLLTLI